MTHGDRAEAFHSLSALCCILGLWPELTPRFGNVKAPADSVSVGIYLNSVVPFFSFRVKSILFLDYRLWMRLILLYLIR